MSVSALQMSLKNDRFRKSKMHHYFLTGGAGVAGVFVMQRPPTQLVLPVQDGCDEPQAQSSAPSTQTAHLPPTHASGGVACVPQTPFGSNCVPGVHVEPARPAVDLSTQTFMTQVSALLVHVEPVEHGHPRLPAVHGAHEPGKSSSLYSDQKVSWILAQTNCWLFTSKFHNLQS